MKEPVHKELDKLAQRIFRDGILDSPSANFVDQIMAQVHVVAKNNTTIYRPLISTKAWVFIFAVAALLVFWVLFNDGSNPGFNFFEKLYLTKFSISNILSSLSIFKFSETFVYAFVFFGIMLCLQMSFLKHYFDRKMR